MEFREYEAKAYAESSLLAALEEEEWSIGMYSGGLLADDEGKARFVNLLPSKRGFNNNMLFVKWQLQLTGFRYAPYCLKPYMFVYLRHLVELKNPPDGETMYNWDNVDFYKINENKGGCNMEYLKRKLPICEDFVTAAAIPKTAKKAKFFMVY